MKKFFVTMCFVLVGMVCMADPVSVDFSVEIIDNSPILPGHGKSPILVPSVMLNDHQLEFQGNHPVYTLVLLHEDGEVVYSTVVPTGTSTVVLPATLTGDFELRLYPDGTAYFFYGWIEL